MKTKINVTIAIGFSHHTWTEYSGVVEADMKSEDAVFYRRLQEPLLEQFLKECETPPSVSFATLLSYKVVEKESDVQV